MTHIGIALLWSCLQITLVSLTAVVACWLLAPGQTRERGRVLQTSLLLTLGLSVLAFSPWPRWQAVSSPSDVTFSRSITSLDNLDIPDSQLPPAAGDAARATDDGSSDKLAADQQRSPVTVAIDRLPAMTTALMLIGCLFGLSRFVIGLVAIRRTVRESWEVTDDGLLALVREVCQAVTCDRDVVVRESVHLTTAATVGWRQPVILLPAAWRDWSETERRAVLAHELAHVVRLDFASLIMAQLNTILHFYHPLVHWLVARLRLEQELIADSMAARVAGGSDTYLTVLATMALRGEERTMGWPARSFLPTHGTFIRRIEMLNESPHTTPGIRSAMAVIGLAAVIAMGVVVAGLRSPAVRAQNKPPALAGGQAAPAVAEDLQTSFRHLKQLGLAMHLYHQDYGRLPPPVVAGEKGQTHSWRVALLPYLDAKELYEQYKLDEPWDSAHNRGVLNQVPEVFRAPLDKKDSVHSSYFVFAGEGTAFSSPDGVSFKDILDGTSNTLLLVEVKMEVPWTKPQDITYPPQKSQQDFEGWYPDRLLATLGDGSARAFPTKLDQKVSQALIEIADGARIDWSEIPNPKE